MTIHFVNCTKIPNVPINAFWPIKQCIHGFEIFILVPFGSKISNSKTSDFVEGGILKWPEALKSKFNSPSPCNKIPQVRVHCIFQKMPLFSNWTTAFGNCNSSVKFEFKNTRHRVYQRFWLYLGKIESRWNLTIYHLATNNFMGVGCFVY